MFCIISLINDITSDESGFAEVCSSYMLHCFAGEGK